MTSRAVSLPLLLVACASVASAQSRAGGEIRVNTYTTNTQSQPNAAARRDGSWIVTWSSSGEDDSNSAVLVHHYDRTGAGHGEAFIVNTYTTGFQGGPAIATSNKAAVVSWYSLGQDGSGSGVYGQRLNATHNPVGGEFRVNSFTLNYQYAPAIASHMLGSFVVAWASYGQDGAGYGIFARRFDASGNGLGTEFRVNTYTTGPQTLPAVAVAPGNPLVPGGAFVVVWEGGANQDGARAGVFGQRYDAAGNRVGGEFRVNTTTANDQGRPSVGMADDGSFVVVWQSTGQDGSGLGVFGQRYDANGVASGAEFPVNAFTTNDQGDPSVVVDAEGNFAVAWRSNAQDGDQGGVFVRRFTKTGTPRGGEFRGNTTVAGDQGAPTLAGDRIGNLAVYWTSLPQDGSDAGVYGQRFGGLLPPIVAGAGIPAALAMDPAGNGVFEPGETVAMQPAWENVSGAAESVAGLLTDFRGPAGATYIIADDTASYGIIPAGGVQSCTFSSNCYALTVTAPPQRPVLHWDATVLETLSPADQGQGRRWILHLGDSFVDVPRTSGFYRFVETLLHNQITSGCNATSFCPSLGTSRQEMAVFALVSKEGSGYTPPACTTPVFADVPATSGFCRWVEELYRRGIVGGCATNPLRYCPTDVVTREQMAVFLLRTLDPNLNPVACTTKPYEDVEISSPYCRWITELVARGITSGCGGGNYCPGAAVTREQMSVFLTTTFGLTLYSGAL